MFRIIPGSIKRLLRHLVGFGTSFLATREGEEPGIGPGVGFRSKIFRGQFLESGVMILQLGSFQKGIAPC